MRNKSKDGHRGQLPRWIASRLNLILLALVVLATLPAQTASAQERRCFSETGYCIEGRFLQYWQENGGLPVFGYPISSARREQVGNWTGLVQWFERQRLELHPENAYPYDVLLGRLGAEQGSYTKPAPAVASKPGCTFFAETGHNVCDTFAAFWSRFGLSGLGAPANSIGLWGMPLAEETTTLTPDGVTRRIQYFERYVFISYPEHAGDPDWETQTLPLGSYRLCGVNGPCPKGPSR